MSQNPENPRCHFLQLPRELRNTIYKLILEPKAAFLLAEQVNPEYGFSSPISTSIPEEEEESSNYCKDWSVSLITHEAYENWGLTPRLFYRLTEPSPLQVACKQTYEEIKQEMALIGNTVQASIHGWRIVPNPEPLFVELCGRSTFIFQSTRWRTFLCHLPTSVRLQVSSIVVAPEQAPAMPFVWHRFEDIVHDFPRLREVSLKLDAIGNTGVAPKPRWKWHSSREEAKWMAEFFLKKKHIDVLRLIYHEKVETAALLCPHLYKIESRMVKRPIAKGRIVYADEQEWIPRGLNHRFENCPRIDEKLKRWAMIGARAVITLTREENADGGLFQSITHREYKDTFGIDAQSEL
jgi:hypothetical protein